MKVFTASLAHETNTFSSLPTGMANYMEFGMFRGDGSKKSPEGVGVFVNYVRQLAEADGYEVSESIAAWAPPGGRTTKHVYEELREQLLIDLRNSLPVDFVQLFLHGAMAADGYDDCEGDILARVRNIVGPSVPVGVELDLHCHFTEQMRRSADAIICFKEYPHVDGRERAEELYHIMVDTAEKRFRPVSFVFDCKMIGLWHTAREPLKSFVLKMQAAEKIEGVLSVSLAHGFPWGDVAENGAKLWVTTDGDTELAQRIAQDLGREFWSLRFDLAGDTPEIDVALDRALALPAGPVVMADIADNPGGGAPGDSTFILRRLVERGVANCVVGTFWDLGAVHICASAGVGATLNLRVGGKCGPASGDPLDLKVTVRAILENHSQQTLDGRLPLGRSVWVETDHGVHIVITSLRNQVFGRDAFTGLGLSLEDKSIIVVKSAQHFHADFAALATNIFYVSAPGAVPPSYGSIDFRKRDLAYWPRVADPHLNK